MLVEDSNSIFEVDYVQDMNVTQPNNDDSPVMVVTNRTDFAYDAITLTECNDGNNQICRVKFQLLASFFEESDPPNLIVSGIVKLKLKTTQTRQLYQFSDISLYQDINNVASNNRKLERNEGVDFTLNVPLSSNIDSASFDVRKVQNGYAIMLITGMVYGLW